MCTLSLLNPGIGLSIGLDGRFGWQRRNVTPVLVWTADDDDVYPPVPQGYRVRKLANGKRYLVKVHPLTVPSGYRLTQATAHELQAFRAWAELRGRMPRRARAQARLARAQA